MGSRHPQNISNTLIASHINSKEPINSLLPPIAADEEKREQKNTAPNDSVPEAANISIFDNIASNIDSNRLILG